MIYALLNFSLSIVFKRNDIADVVWGVGFVIVSLYLIIQTKTTPTAYLVYALVSIWGVRLSIYIGWRNSRKTEDYRYKQWRDAWKKSFYWRSFLQVYLLQMLLLLIIAAPILIGGIYSNHDPVNGFQGFFALIWLAGFLWQAIADYQLSQFKKLKTGGVMNNGLWKYSRHPNYFGEILMWWSIYGIVFGGPYGAWSIIGPVLITFLILKVSGVPMLEEKYKSDPAYQDYVNRVPAIFPFWK